MAPPTMSGNSPMTEGVTACLIVESSKLSNEASARTSTVWASDPTVRTTSMRERELMFNSMPFCTNSRKPFAVARSS